MGYPGNGSAVIDDPDQLAQADANEPAGPDEGGQPAPPETDAYPAAPDQPSPVQAVPLATTPPAQPIAPLVNQAAGPVMGTGFFFR